MSYSEKRIQLSDHFSFRRLLRFVYPSITMMLFTSIYGVVDGLFISNYAGKTAFASVNFIMPVLMIIGSAGFMLGSGGNAVVSHALGANKPQKANRCFSLFVYTTLVIGCALVVIMQIILRPLAIFIGASQQMLPIALLYGRITLCSMPCFMLMNLFQSFLVTAEKPKLGLCITIGAGLTNMILDFLLVGVFRLGVTGAAVATVTSETIGGLLPLLYFAKKNTSRLQLCKTTFDFQILLKASTNGASEFLTNVSISFVNVLYNFQLMRLIGENGVSAYGVMMYVGFIFLSVFLGYAVGIAPLIGFNHGSENYRELKNLFRKSLLIIGVCGICMFSLAMLLAPLLAEFFFAYDNALFELTRDAFRMYGIAFLIMGFNIFGSAFFTALENGAVSAAISFLRTLLFQVIAVFLLPFLFGPNSIWLSIVFAESLSLVVTTSFLLANKKTYRY